jgi:non-ribosomal peptide synthetase component F
MIGCFINTVILRADLADARPADDLIRQVHLSTFSALQHQEFPFDVIKAIAEQEFDRHPSDLFNVLIVMQNSLESLPAHIDTLSIIEWDEAPLIGRTPTTAPLTLFIKQSRGERVRLQLRYVEKMFSQAQALFILEGISSSLESLV